MKNYIGIDLGTTNSAICSYDGENTRIWKSPEQNDVTRSAIYIDRRGNRFYGLKAYNQAPYDPDNSATLFKRYMGTSMKLNFKAARLTLTPEECSAEILKVLYGYLPEEIRNDPETAVVITVPAAFNQMKKSATLKAAEFAGIKRVALMQEPVAAVMSVMKASSKEGIFLVYDLGGGTFDVSLAENIGGRVNLLAHGGVEMCGGRDIDRTIFNQIIVPWLRSNFSLPSDFLTNPKYKTFCRIAQWSAEQAKMELSSAETATIALSENEARTIDEKGTELYLDIDITRSDIDILIENIVNETIEETRSMLSKAGLTSSDIEKIVFVGGPTNYKPLRDRVCFELALPANTDVNPMTAVCEGASIFAESIDWSSQEHSRKAINDTAGTSVDLSFKYSARVTGDRAKVMCIVGRELSGYTISFISMDTGWSSGNAALKNNTLFDLPLAHKGENSFLVKVFDEFGREKSIGLSKLVITKTFATIGAIPASSSIGIEVLNKLGGTSELYTLVNEGDALPKKVSFSVKSGQTLKASSYDSINIKLWEGDIQSPITDNRFIGVLKIAGTDIESGVIPTGADIECEFELYDSGTISIEVSIPCIGAVFGSRNFYSRQEGQLDLEDIDGLAQQGKGLLRRIDDMAEKVSDPRLDSARERAAIAADIDSQEIDSPEDVQKAHDELLKAKKLMNEARQENLHVIRQMELDSCVNFINASVRQSATSAENAEFDSLIRTAQRAIDRDAADFENILKRMRIKYTSVLIRQDWFIIDWYKRASASPAGYMDAERFRRLKSAGDEALENGNLSELKNVLGELLSIKIHTDMDEGMYDAANIIKG